MKKLLIALMAITALFCLTFAACGNQESGGNNGGGSGGKDDTPTTYTVTIAVDNGTYGTVSKTSVNVAKDTAISVNGNVLTIGTETVTATPAQATAQYTYAFDEFAYTGTSVTGNITVTAKFTRTLNEYTVSVVANSDYFTVSTTSVTVPYGTEMSCVYNVLTVGDTEITVTPRDEKYVFISLGEVAETVTGNLELDVEFVIDITTFYDDGVIYVGLKDDGDNVAIELPVAVGTVTGFSVGNDAVATEYDDDTQTITIEKTALASLEKGQELDCNFDGGEDPYYTKIYVADYVLRTAEDVTNKLRKTEFYDNSENGGREYDYYSFVLANDIEGGTISNNPGSWHNKYDGVIDGRGHVLKNLTIDDSGENYGLINTVAANGAVIKNIAFVDMISPRTFITHTASGITLENVFVSGVAGWGELFSVLKGDGATLNNVILKNNGGDPYSINGESIYDEDGGGTLTKNNYIKVTDNFFTTYADGLGEAWDDSGFTIESDGLYINGTMILANS